MDLALLSLMLSMWKLKIRAPCPGIVLSQPVTTSLAWVHS